MKEQVRRTVIHEIAHHFGIDDTYLRELGWQGLTRQAATGVRLSCLGNTAIPPSE